jgi:hypothetical protein
MTGDAGIEEWHGIRIGDRVRFLRWGGTTRQGSFVVVGLRSNDPFGSGNDNAIARIDDGQGNIREVSASVLAKL